MKISDNVGVTFVNTVIGRGTLNGVFNLSFSTFNFTPSDDGERVDLDPVVSCRLRMDKACAVQLRDVMNDLISLIEREEAKGVMSAESEGIMPKHSGEIN